MTTPTFYRNVMTTSGEESRQAAKRITAAVLRALRDRLTPEEADQAAAQLPRELQEIWTEGETSDRRPLKMDREAFYERVMREAGLPSRVRAQWATLGVFAALKEQLSPGEAEDVLAQLPKDIKQVWADAQLR